LRLFIYFRLFSRPSGRPRYLNPITNGQTGPRETCALSAVASLLGTHSKNQIKWVLTIIPDAYGEEKGQMRSMRLWASISGRRFGDSTELAPATFKVITASPLSYYGGVGATLLLPLA
jgi:hypothetical protein